MIGKGDSVMFQTSKEATIFLVTSDPFDNCGDQMVTLQNQKHPVPVKKLVKIDVLFSTDF